MPKRNKKLAEEFAKKPCAVCGSTYMVSGHHLITFKSRPDLDIKENLMPLCFTHHREIHDKGLNQFVVEHSLQMNMFGRGFGYSQLYGKWYWPDRREDCD